MQDSEDNIFFKTKSVQKMILNMKHNGTIYKSHCDISQDYT